MNKLLLNNKGRNHIKIMPLNDMEIPQNEGEKIKLCEKLFNELQNSDNANRLFLKKDRKKGFQISVWELEKTYYLIQSMRNEFGSYNNIVYITRNKEDTIHIAEFLVNNIRTIMNDYKKQILDANEMKVLQNGETPN